MCVTYCGNFGVIQLWTCLTRASASGSRASFLRFRTSVLWRWMRSCTTGTTRTCMPFLPFAVVRQVFNYGSRNTHPILIAPFWSQTEWFPDLVMAVIAPPRRLHPRRDLLRQPHVCRFHQSPRPLPDRLATIKRLLRHRGYSSRVEQFLVKTYRPSTPLHFHACGSRTGSGARERATLLPHPLARSLLLSWSSFAWNVTCQLLLLRAIRQC